VSVVESRKGPAPRPEAHETGTHRRWLVVGRAVWVAVTVLTLGLTAAGFAAGLDNWELIGSKSIYLAITSAGIPVSLVTVLGLILPSVVYATTGIIIFLRRPGDWFAMVFALMLITLTTFRPLLALERAAPMLRIPIEVVWLLAIFLLLISLFVFPDGRFVPSWTRLVAVAAVPAAAFLSAPMRSIMKMPDRPTRGITADLVTAILILLVYFAMGIGAQIYRYRKTSNHAQRQQTKLVGLAIGLLSSALTLGFAVPSLFMDTAKPWFAWAMLATVPVFLLVPSTVAVAILRYRLFDIDRIISRTLAYVALSLVLTAVYISTVLLLSQLVGGRSDLSVAGATLAVAAVFRPAQRRLQDIVDRRFNRRKYDALRTVERFGGRLRDELDVEALERALLDVVQYTMQPTKLSLWRVLPESKV